MQPAMCLQCLDILNTKGLEAEAQSHILTRLWKVVKGKFSCFQLTFEYKSYSNCSLVNLGSNM